MWTEFKRKMKKCYEATVVRYEKETDQTKFCRMFSEPTGQSSNSCYASSMTPFGIDIDTLRDMLEVETAGDTVIWPVVLNRTIATQYLSWQ